MFACGLFPDLFSLNVSKQRFQDVSRGPWELAAGGYVEQFSQ